jgi:hypothetical protein
MANARFPGSQAPGSVDSSASPCPGCGATVDALRAGHVAIFGGRFRYFCRAECKQAYLHAHGRPLEEHVVTARPPDVVQRNGGASRGKAGFQPLPEIRFPPPDGSSLPLPAAPAIGLAPTVSPLPPEPAPKSPRWVRGNASWRADPLAALDLVGIVSGVLVPAIGLLGPAVDWARNPLLLAACVALVIRVLAHRHDAADPHGLVVLAPAGGAVVAAFWASGCHDPRAGSLASFAALCCAAGLAIEMLVARARARVCAARESIERALDVRVRIAQGDDVVYRASSDVRPGEQIVVEPGELVGVDATVTAGETRVIPWLGAKLELVRREGDPVLAGARVVSNSLRMSTTWSSVGKASISARHAHRRRVADR